MSARKRQQYVDQAYTYTRMFCGSLSGFSILLLIITAPLSWVQFLVTNSGLELYAGLWTLCHHELCWSHIPKPPCECHTSQCHRPTVPELSATLHVCLSSFKIFGSETSCEYDCPFYWYPALRPLSSPRLIPVPNDYKLVVFF